MHELMDRDTNDKSNKNIGENTEKDQRKSGFDAPTIGVVLPKDAVIKRNPDGTLTVINGSGDEK